MNLTLQRIGACLWVYYVVACAVRADAASAQVIVASPSNPDDGRRDQFRSLGIDADGEVWILGDCKNCESDQTLFHFTGDGFESMPIVPLPSAYYADARRISRDGQYIIGITERDGIDEPTLWTRREGLVPKSLGYFLECCRTDPWDVASTAMGPLVVGRYRFGTFLWGEGTGFQSWMTNSEFWPLRESHTVSADGTKWAGEQLSLSGSNLISLPFLGTETTLELLETKGSPNCRVFAISPNGKYVSGWIGQQTTIWTRKKAETLSLGTNITLLRSVTDNGYAGGVSTGGIGVIYDSHGKKLELFDEWWGKNYPDVPLPAPVTEVSDLYEHGGSLYCLIRFFDSIAEYYLSALAIAPLKRGSNQGSH